MKGGCRPEGVKKRGDICNNSIIKIFLSSKYIESIVYIIVGVVILAAFYVPILACPFLSL